MWSSPADRQQCGRQQGEADQDPQSAVYALAEQRDDQSGDRYTDGAGIYGNAHRCRRDVIGPRQRRKDRLGREQVVTRSVWQTT
jgi:hypothetical protein